MSSELPAKSKRLLFLEQLVQKGQADSFSLYALALEYKSTGQVEEALRTFVSLKEQDPGYVPQYLMAGQLLAGADRKDEARAWLTEGIGRARSTGNSHALSELESALASL